MKVILGALVLLLSQSAFAYKMTIYTDQADQSKANEIVNTFKATYPFNQFTIEYEIKLVPAEDLECTQSGADKRLLNCNQRNIARDARRSRSDQAMIVKENPAYGGSGGAIPVISTGSPARMMLHEYLHTLGLCDEYAYSGAEIATYCSNTGPNLVVIEPKEGGYASDDEARSMHMRRIPWGTAILAQTKITTSTNLGTGTVNSSVPATINDTNEPNRIGAPIGLYPSKSCINAVPAIHSWQPGGETTVMEDLQYGLGAGNELMVAKVLSTRGVPWKADAVIPTYSFINSRNRDTRVNDSRVMQNKAEPQGSPRSSQSTGVSR